MAAPVVVTLDRGGLGALDLTPLLHGDSIRWSSVVPGGFGSCSFQLDGDFRQLVKQVPYLSILRVIGDSGRVLFEGQIEDLAPTLSTSAVGLKVGAFGLQNTLREVTTRSIWSKRDLTWQQRPSTAAAPDPAFTVQTGNFDPTDLTKSGISFVGGNGTTAFAAGKRAHWVYQMPPGTAMGSFGFTYDKAGNANLLATAYHSLNSGAAFTTDLSSATNVTGSAQSFASGGANQILLGVEVVTADFVSAITDFVKFYNIRVLANIATEDVVGTGFYGGTLIRSLLSYAPGLGAGTIEAGSDFTVDHLDASTRRTIYDLLSEVAQYYAREWAVWENGLLDWRTPQLSQPQWIVPIAQLQTLELDASVQNSQSRAVVLYTDAPSGQTAEQSASSSDRRNPYVLNGRTKDLLDSTGFPMTTNTAQQFATRLLNDLGFGPVPAAGTISLHGETIVQHAQGNAVKAWEIRAGDNVTIPELPLADVFTQDGRGECLFHIVAAEASASDGLVTLTLDSYGSKRSDVLLARLAAVTHALGG